MQKIATRCVAAQCIAALCITALFASCSLASLGVSLIDFADGDTEAISDIANMDLHCSVGPYATITWDEYVISWDSDTGWSTVPSYYEIFRSTVNPWDGFEWIDSVSTWSQTLTPGRLSYTDYDIVPGGVRAWYRVRCSYTETDDDGNTTDYVKLSEYVTAN
jgi:hypothetical protein